MGRLRGFDYKSPYFYMVTLKRLKGLAAFSEIGSNGLVENAITRAFTAAIRGFHLKWRCCEEISPFVIMPDHLHLLFKIRAIPDRVALGGSRQPTRQGPAQCLLAGCRGRRRDRQNPSRLAQSRGLPKPCRLGRRTGSCWWRTGACGWRVRATSRPEPRNACAPPDLRPHLARLDCQERGPARRLSPLHPRKPGARRPAPRERPLLSAGRARRVPRPPLVRLRQPRAPGSACSRALQGPPCDRRRLARMERPRRIGRAHRPRRGGRLDLHEPA